eukprot:30814-Pelagococcus_subviridis.AAC.9
MTKNSSTTARLSVPVVARDAVAPEPAVRGPHLHPRRPRLRRRRESVRRDDQVPGALEPTRRDSLASPLRSRSRARRRVPAAPSRLVRAAVGAAVPQLVQRQHRRVWGPVHPSRVRLRAVLRRDAAERGTGALLLLLPDAPRERTSGLVPSVVMPHVVESVRRDHRGRRGPESSPRRLPGPVVRDRRPLRGFVRPRHALLPRRFESIRDEHRVRGSSKQLVVPGLVVAEQA